MYADDIELLSDTPQGMQLLLDAVSDWCPAHDMVVNPSKSEAMKFPCSPQHPPLEFVPTCQGVPLSVVFLKRYLGVKISSELGVGATFPFLRSKMWASWSAVLRQYGNLQCAPSVGLLLKVVMACVLPTASYACEVWAFSSVLGGEVSHAHLEKDFLLMLRMLVGVRRTTATPVLLQELGVTPIRFHWLKRMATFYNSLLTLPPDHLFSAVLHDSWSCYYRGGTSWVGSFVAALRNAGYFLPRSRSEVAVRPVDMRELGAVFRNACNLPWENLSISPRLCMSAGAQRCKYKNWFFPPSTAARTRLLLLRVSASKLRLFHRFRMGDHGLPIDALRLRRPSVPRHLRYCDMCTQPTLGDEYHFVFDCPVLQPVRGLYPHLFQPDCRALIRFMWQDDLVAVVHFIAAAFAFRRSFLAANS